MVRAAPAQPGRCRRDGWTRAGSVTALRLAHEWREPTGTNSALRPQGSVPRGRGLAAARDELRAPPPAPRLMARSLASWTRSRAADVGCDCGQGTWIRRRLSRANSPRPDARIAAGVVGLTSLCAHGTRALPPKESRPNVSGWSAGPSGADSHRASLWVRPSRLRRYVRLRADGRPGRRHPQADRGAPRGAAPAGPGGGEPRGSAQRTRRRRRPIVRDGHRSRRRPRAPCPPRRHRGSR